jgi:hypothetical protein
MNDKVQKKVTPRFQSLYYLIKILIESQQWMLITSSGQITKHTIVP